MNDRSPVFGLMIEFDAPAGVLRATRQAREAGYRHMDAYTPHPVEGLAAELGVRGSRVPGLVLAGGLVGAAVGFGMQYWTMAVDYRYDAGGRPPNSWPAFAPIAFEMLVLVAALSTVLGVLFLNGLPRLNHPLFNVPQFARATQDRFFLCIEATDPRFDLEATAAFLNALDSHSGAIVVPREEYAEPPTVRAPLPVAPSEVPAS